MIAFSCALPPSRILPGIPEGNGFRVGVAAAGPALADRTARSRLPAPVRLRRND
jgi:hypothetical protein